MAELSAAGWYFAAAELDLFNHYDTARSAQAESWMFHERGMCE